MLEILWLNSRAKFEIVLKINSIDLQPSELAYAYYILYILTKYALWFQICFCFCLFYFCLSFCFSFW